MDDNGLGYWLALGRLKGLEGISLGGVLERFGSPEAIFGRGKDGLEFFSSSFAAAVKQFKDWDWVDRELELIKKHGVDVITFSDPRYPPLLKAIHDPPCLLYTKGRLYGEGSAAVAIVGTRYPTHYGLKMAETLARDLAAAGVVVVSGMARGCDMAAHKGALASGGFTAAVLGTGVDIAYPKESARLYREILEKGLMISEYPISTPPLPQNFPRRNRIISGLSIGVVVVEAPLRSGSLMTARLALDYNREVLAVPGQATSYRSTGANQLIREGAALVEGAKDVVDALSLGLKITAQKPGVPALEGEEKLLWRALVGDEPVHIDSIIEKTGLSASRASTLLLEMEIKGLVLQRPGKCFSRGGP